MQQSAFNSIQNNFKKFLNSQRAPIEEKKLHVIPPSSARQIERIEQTHGFGSQDSAIGYRISYIDSKGITRTKLVAHL